MSYEQGIPLASQTGHKGELHVQLRDSASVNMIEDEDEDRLRETPAANRWPPHMCVLTCACMPVYIQTDI